MSGNTQNPSSAHGQRRVSAVLCETCARQLPARFWKLVDKRDDGCWQWLGSVRTTKYKHSRYRYGSYNNKLVHRLAYTALVGPIPDGLELDHRCHNTLCVNPYHLEPVPHQVNCARRRKSGPYSKKHLKQFVLSSLLLVALLTPAPHRTVNDMFVLAEVARKSYAQFSLNFEPSVTGVESKTEVTSVLEPAALPAVLAQLAAKYRPLIDRVLARLSEAEREEVNTHLQQDIRQAWITVSYAQRMSDAFVQASYAIYGKHPDQIWPSIVADRKERLGKEYYEWFDSSDMPRPDVPKIPPTSTANADTHAAHESRMPVSGTTESGSVPTERKLV